MHAPESHESWQTVSLTCHDIAKCVRRGIEIVVGLEGLRKAKQGPGQLVRTTQLFQSRHKPPTRRNVPRRDCEGRMESIRSRFDLAEFLKCLSGGDVKISQYRLPLNPGAKRIQSLLRSASTRVCGAAFQVMA